MDPEQQGYNTGPEGTEDSQLLTDSLKNDNLQLNEQVEKAITHRESIDEKHMAAVKIFQACEESLDKWQDELVFSQADISKSE